MSVVLAGRYAKVLLELSEENSALDDMYIFLQSFSSVLKENVVKSFMLNPTISKKVKEEFFLDIELQDSILFFHRFMSVLLNNGREAILTSVIQMFFSLYKKKKQILDVQVVSYSTLTKNQKGLLEEKILNQQKKYTSISLEETLDDTLLGGFVLSFDNKQVNCSLLGKLDAFKRQLL